MLIEFRPGSAGEHPNFERYMTESTADGTVPLRFDWRTEPGGRRRRPPDPVNELSGHRRFRVLAVARHHKPDIDRVVVREPVDSSAP